MAGRSMPKNEGGGRIEAEDDEAVGGLRVTVRGLDAIDGTPALDLKPVMRELLPRCEVVQPAWSTELMADYW